PARRARQSTTPVAPVPAPAAASQAARDTLVTVRRQARAAEIADERRTVPSGAGPRRDCATRRRAVSLRRRHGVLLVLRAARPAPRQPGPARCRCARGGDPRDAGARATGRSGAAVPDAPRARARPRRDARSVGTARTGARAARRARTARAPVRAGT